MRGLHFEEKISQTQHQRTCGMHDRVLPSAAPKPERAASSSSTLATTSTCSVASAASRVALYLSSDHSKPSAPDNIPGSPSFGGVTPGPRAAHPARQRNGIRIKRIVSCDERAETGQIWW